MNDKDDVTNGNVLTYDMIREMQKKLNKQASIEKHNDIVDVLAYSNTTYTKSRSEKVFAQDYMQRMMMGVDFADETTSETKPYNLDDIENIIKKI